MVDLKSVELYRAQIQQLIELSRLVTNPEIREELLRRAALFQQLIVDEAAAGEIKPPISTD